MAISRETVSSKSARIPSSSITPDDIAGQDPQIPNGPVQHRSGVSDPGSSSARCVLGYRGTEAFCGIWPTLTAPSGSSWRTDGSPHDRCEGNRRADRPPKVVLRSQSPVTCQLSLPIDKPDAHRGGSPVHRPRWTPVPLHIIVGPPLNPSGVSILYPSGREVGGFLGKGRDLYNRQTLPKQKNPRNLKGFRGSCL